MAKKRFSKDNKVELIDLWDFLIIKWLRNAKNHLWTGKQPEPGIYFKITPDKLLMIHYDQTTTNYGMNFTPKLELIRVAYRNKELEEKFFQKARMSLEEMIADTRRANEIQALRQELDKLNIGQSLLEQVAFSDQDINVKQMSFEDYIVNVDYITPFEHLKDKYVVFDVETNGLRKVNDDLLSISIYHPSNGKCYNRFLPLDLQPLVLTTWINGIRDEDLADQTHITQEELDKLIETFDLKNKILLSFSGGRGTFDYDFIINYCKRYNLTGFENLKFESIKASFPNPGFFFSGQMSKDNLCRLFNIDNVKDIHTSLNDCVLQWKLYEKLKNGNYFFIKEKLFKLSDKYILPISYLNKYPTLAEAINFPIPNIAATPKLVFEYSLSSELLKSARKFGQNIEGITIENRINAMINAQKQDNYEFLVKNKSHLEYVGSLTKAVEEIPVFDAGDGSLISLDPRYNELIKEVNDSSLKITQNLYPIIDFIKERIFRTGKILSQELSISQDNKVLALCDLSDENSVLEIKTFEVSENGTIPDSLARQLYYQAKGRKTYTLSVDISSRINFNNEKIIDSITVRIYRILMEGSNLDQLNSELEPWENEVTRLVQKEPQLKSALQPEPELKQDTKNETGLDTKSELQQQL